MLCSNCLTDSCSSRGLCWLPESTAICPASGTSRHRIFCRDLQGGGPGVLPVSLVQQLGIPTWLVLSPLHVGEHKGPRTSCRCVLLLTLATSLYQLLIRRTIIGYRRVSKFKTLNVFRNSPRQEGGVRKTNPKLDLGAWNYHSWIQGKKSSTCVLSQLLLLRCSTYRSPA